MTHTSISLDPFNTTTTSNKFQISWPQYLASKRELIYAQIVLKSRERASWSKKKSIEQLSTAKTTIKQTSFDSRSMGAVFRDQLDIIQYLVDNFPNIDRKRIMLIGTGTSAYTALGSLADDKSNLINAAIAIAPVVNWRLIGMLIEIMISGPFLYTFNWIFFWC